MRYKLPPLNALRAFEVTGRTGSLSGASRELGVSVGAVSRHVNLLEEFLGYRLFVRQHNGMVLTQWGEAYHEQIASAFELIDGAGRGLQLGSRHTIRFRAYTSFATEWLTPRLPDFRRRHPDIVVQLKQSLNETNFASEPLDAAISALPVMQRDVASVDLFNTVFVLVCADGAARFKAMQGDFFSPGAPPILFARREIPFWEQYFEQMNLPPPPFASGLEFDNLSLTYQAARSGAGVALGQLFLVADDLISGRLSPAASVCVEIDLPHRFVYRTGRDTPSEIAHFRNWMLEQAAETLAKMAQIRKNLADLQVPS
ncbi:LysR substrate-binding domain-containing protein [Hyphomonas chukchiensis]|nr:LysR substrate-binding domain-containing protein [Hyphomonas chukchiensis]